MSVWKSVLKADATAWLLEKGNPSVRYLTLVKICGMKTTAPEARHAREEIMLSGVVPEILQKQSEGSWSGPGRFYADKYKGTVWQLIILAEHAADGANRQVRDACEFILRHSQDPDSHGFSYKESARHPGGLHSEVIPCLTGNMVWSLITLGYGNDERVARGAEWIARYQRSDDGIDAAPRGWPYDRYEMCWGKHSCHMGVVKSLKALSAVPKGKRDKSIDEAIRRGCEYLLVHHIFKRSHDLAKTSKPGWKKLQFPLMYQTDLLEILGIMLDLGIRDDRMQEAIDIVLSKQSKAGKWNMEATFNGRFQVDIETKGTPSKWITYRALNVLKKYYET